MENTPTAWKDLEKYLSAPGSPHDDCADAENDGEDVG